ncbi:MAG TPA: hypothetical protein PKJ51_12190, partial [Methanothrix sp.]|nr:hypothetical protein [Methanothrix sp.]
WAGPDPEDYPLRPGEVILRREGAVLPAGPLSSISSGGGVLISSPFFWSPSGSAVFGRSL